MKLATENENKILRAATDVFLEQGLKGARMEEIAARAGLNKAMLHYYFRSKNKLYEHVFKSKVQEFFVGLFNSIPEIDEIKEFTRVFIFNYIERIRKNPQVVRFILWEIGSGGELLRQTVDDVLNSKPKFTPFSIIEKFRIAAEQKHIRAVEPLNLFISILGMSVFMFIARPILGILFEKIRDMPDEFVELRKSEVFELVWNGIKCESK